jgi:hypothetical protein
MTISGKQLPPPDPKFDGEIKEKASESKPWWAPRVVPPKGAPNVLLIMTDDCGFGAPAAGPNSCRSRSTGASRRRPLAGVRDVLAGRQGLPTGRDPR